MEKIKTFEDIVREQGGTITPWELDEEFTKEFEEYMKKSVQESRLNHARAIESARNIIINI